MAYLVLLFALLLPSAGNAQGATDGVCGRTQQVRDELVRLAGAGDCASVTADNLAAITGLDLDNKAIASLQASDFAGLTSLVYLLLRNNQLSLDSFPGGLFSSLPLSIRSIEVSGNPGCPSHGNLCFPPAPTVDVLVGTDEREIAIVRTAETVRLRSGPGDYRDPLGRSLRTAWSQNTGTVVNLAAAYDGWSAAFSVPHVTADEDAEFVLTVTSVNGRWSRTILNDFWEEANTQADLTFAPPLPSSDTSLIELEIYGVTPRYNSSTRIYELTVPNSVTTVSVRANPRERNAVVEISPPDSQPATGHQVDLEPGANSISITVTATDEVTTQTYTVTVTRDESAGVCGRTQQVRDELVRLAGAGDCASVTADNLAAITGLDLDNKAIASLQASDFAGLTSLVYLLLRNNQLSLDSFPGGLFSSLPLTIRSIDVSGNPGCPSHGNLCFPPTPTVDVLVGTDEREIAIVRTAETVRLRSGPGDYRDPLGRSLRTAWSQNTGTVVNLVAAYDGWSAAFTVPHVTADEDAEFVLTVTSVNGRWSITILNNFWSEANPQADLTFSPPDTAAPQVASIARQSPTSSPTRADSLTWRVTFSETVANVDEADFEVGVTTATLTVAAVPGSSVAHDVTVEGGNLAGLTGTVTLAFASDHDIADTAGNALTNTVPTGANDNTFELDNTAPTVTIGGVPETSTAPFTATITFTEPVTGFVLADIALANATASNFTGTDGVRAFAALITPTATGAVTVDVAANVATDAAGNDNTAATQATSTYTAPVDNTAPTSSDGRVIATQDTDYTFKATDFPFMDADGDDRLASVKITSLPGTGALKLGGTAIVAANLPKTVTVDQLNADSLTYSPPAGESGGDFTTFEFRVSDGADDSASVYTMTIDVTSSDTTAPEVTSIERRNPALSPTNEDELTWLVTFDEDVENMDAPDFEMDGTTATLEVEAVPGSSTQYEVTASGGDLAGLNATVTLSFASAQDIVDTAGNALADTTPTGTNENTYDVDNTPTVTITGVPATSSAPFTATFTFTEAVTGFVLGDIGVGNGTASDFMETSTSVYTALITPAVDGLVTVDVAKEVATDLAGNDNTAATQATSTYTAPVDNTAPTSSDGRVIATQDTDYTFKATDFPFMDADGDGDDTLASVKITSLPGAGALKLGGTAIVAANLPKTVTVDQLNADSLTYSPPAGESGGDFTTFEFRVNDGTDDSASVYTMTIDVTSSDTTAPEVTSIERQVPTTSQTNADSLTWLVTFDEDVENVDATDFEVDGTTAPLGVAAVPGSSAQYEVTASEGDLAGLDGTVTLSFASAQNIVDTAGNALADTTPTGTNENTYDVDNTAPTVTITGVPDPSSAPFTATFTFTEAVTGFAPGDIGVGNGTASDFMETSTSVYTALITPAVDGLVTVDVAKEVATDLAGNDNTAATQATSTYTAPVDNTAPVASDSSVTTQEDTAYAFAEADFNFDDPDPGAALAGVTVEMLPEAGGLTFDGTAENGGAIIPH